MGFCRRITIGVIFSILAYAALASATTFTVSNLNDSGGGSLRQAITNANSNPGPDSIVFSVSGTIQPDSVLPSLQDTIGGTIIDGTTAPGGANSVIINGSLLDTLLNLDAFRIFSADNTIQGLVINQFPGDGIFISMYGNNTVRDNYIGTDQTGTLDLGNGQYGVWIIGGAKSNTISGNVVSGNGSNGITFSNLGTDSNRVTGNYIGVDFTGTEALPNENGVAIYGGGSYNVIGGWTPEERNIFSGNEYHGVLLNGSHNTIVGNYIGTDSSGEVSIGNGLSGVYLVGPNVKHNIVGGSTPEARNVISGNDLNGITFVGPGTDSNSVIGNYIGVDRTGNTALPNWIGVYMIESSNNVIGGWTAEEGNIISGNSSYGIMIRAGGYYNSVVSNYIGTNSELLNLGNQYSGILIREGARRNTVGHFEAGNIIAYNNSAGVAVDDDSSDYNTISGNSIFENGGLGIDLTPLGVTENDSLDLDTGPNENLNFPVILEVNKIDPDSDLYEISGTACPDCRVELFRVNNDDPEVFPDPSGYGEGYYFIGHTNSSPSGDWWFGSVELPEGSFVSATATDSLGNTSEFSFNASWPMYISVYCEGGEDLDLLVVDPAGDSIGVSFNTIPGAFYLEEDFDTNSCIDDRVTIPSPLHGVYLIKVIINTLVSEEAFLAPYTAGVRIDGSDEEFLEKHALLRSSGVDEYVISTLMGDASPDGTINLGDVVYLANHLFGKPGYQLIPRVIGDVNCDNTVNLGDVIYLANYYFGKGPAPCEPF